MDNATISLINNEVAFARDKFPKPDGLVPALVEEFGEFCHAVVDGTNPEIMREVKQIAAVCTRLLEEGDPLISHERVVALCQELEAAEDKARLVLHDLCGKEAAAKTSQ